MRQWHTFGQDEHAFLVAGSDCTVQLRSGGVVEVNVVLGFDELERKSVNIWMTITFLRPHLLDCWPRNAAASILGMGSDTLLRYSGQSLARSEQRRRRRTVKPTRTLIMSTQDGCVAALDLVAAATDLAGAFAEVFLTAAGMVAREITEEAGT